MAVAAEVASGAKLLLCCFETLDRIIELVSVAAENDKSCSHLLGQTAVIKKALESLDMTQVKLSEPVKVGMEFIWQKLANCDDYINDMFDRKLSRPRDFIQSRHYHRNLEQMKSEIDSALTTFNTTMLVQSMHEQQGVKSFILSKEDTGSIPSKPQNMKAAKRAHNRIMVQWEAPSENPEAISCYEVQHRRRWERWQNCEKTTNTEHVVHGLSADTTYWFRVRAMNTKDFPGRFCEEICTETKYSTVARSFITAGATIGEILVSPIIVTFPGAAIYDHVKGELRKKDPRDLHKRMHTATSRTATYAENCLNGILPITRVTHFILKSDFSDDDD